MLGNSCPPHVPESQPRRARPAPKLYKCRRTAAHELSKICAAPAPLRPLAAAHALSPAWALIRRLDVPRRQRKISEKPPSPECSSLHQTLHGRIRPRATAEGKDGPQTAAAVGVVFFGPQELVGQDLGRGRSHRAKRATFFQRRRRICPDSLCRCRPPRSGSRDLAPSRSTSVDSDPLPPLSKLGQAWPNLGQRSPTFANPCQTLDKLDQPGHFFEFGQRKAWPTSTSIGRCGSNFGRCWPTSANMLPTSSKIRRCGSNSTKFAASLLLGNICQPFGNLLPLLLGLWAASELAGGNFPRCVVSNFPQILGLCSTKVGLFRPNMC